MKWTCLSAAICSVLLQCSDIQNSESDHINVYQPGLYTQGTELEFKMYPESDTDYFFTEISQSGLYLININNLPRSMNLNFMLLRRYLEIVKAFEIVSDTTIAIHIAQGSYSLWFAATEYISKSSNNIYFHMYRDTIDTNERANDSYTTTVALNSTYHGAIMPSLDHDIFRLDIDSNKIIHILIDSIPNSLSHFSLDLSDQKEISFKSLMRNGKINEAFALPRGIYFIDLSAGIYESSQTKYRMYLRNDTTDSAEWNNDAESACPVNIGDTIRGAIYPRDDVDYFKFTSYEDDTVVINIDSIPAELQDFSCRILNNYTLQENEFNAVNGQINQTVYFSKGFYYFKLTSCHSCSTAEYSTMKYRLILN